MWKRRTFHECTEELISLSLDFRFAHTNRLDWDLTRRNSVMQDASTRGVEILRILALAIRADQDYGLTSLDLRPVGALRLVATEDEAHSMINAYHPSQKKMSEFSSLNLRQALNKIAHADPNNGGFYADMDTHDIILVGQAQNKYWIAIVSLIDLCEVIRSIPDTSINK